MAKDRRGSRHVRAQHPVGVDTDQWETFGGIVGLRQRAAAIRELIRRFLAAEPMPSHTEMDTIVNRSHTDGPEQQ